MDNFSNKHEIPSVYIIDSIFYEPDSNYMFQFVKYVYPIARRECHENLMVFEHPYDEGPDDECKVATFK